MSEYIVIKRTPTFAEYRELCAAVGWAEFINMDAAQVSLQQSLFGAVIRHEDRIVGMGRVVGDGSMYFYIQDVAVMPEHQGAGVGGRIMEAIVAYLKEHAPEQAFIGLFASEGKEDFYTRFGFQPHEGMTGMFGVMLGGRIQ